MIIINQQGRDVNGKCKKKKSREYNPGILSGRPSEFLGLLRGRLLDWGLLGLEDRDARLLGLGLRDGSLGRLGLDLLRHRLGRGGLGLPGVALALTGIVADGLARERGEALRDHLLDVGRRELGTIGLDDRLGVLGRGGLGGRDLGGLGGGGGLGGLGGHVVFPFVVDFLDWPSWLPYQWLMRLL